MPPGIGAQQFFYEANTEHQYRCVVKGKSVHENSNRRGGRGGRSRSRRDRRI